MNDEAQQAITTSRSLGGLLTVAGLSAQDDLIRHATIIRDVMLDGVLFVTEYIGDGWRVLAVR